MSFAPADRTFGAASGVTDVGGMFRLSTREENDGIRPNDYLVTVRKVSGGAPGDTAASRPPRHLLPTVYGTPETTPLRCIVPPNGPVVIELSSRPQK